MRQKKACDKSQALYHEGILFYVVNELRRTR